MWLVGGDCALYPRPPPIIISPPKRSVIHNLLGNLTSLPTWKNLSTGSRVSLTSSQSITCFPYRKMILRSWGQLSLSSSFLCLLCSGSLRDAGQGDWDRGEIPNY